MHVCIHVCISYAWLIAILSLELFLAVPVCMYVCICYVCMLNCCSVACIDFSCTCMYICICYVCMYVESLFCCSDLHETCLYVCMYVCVCLYVCIFYVCLHEKTPGMSIYAYLLNRSLELTNLCLDMYVCTHTQLKQNRHMHVCIPSQPPPR